MTIIYLRRGVKLYLFVGAAYGQCNPCSGEAKATTATENLVDAVVMKLCYIQMQKQ